MKRLKLNTTTGGFPLFQNDLEFIQEAYEEGINRLGDIITSFDLLNEAPIVILNGVAKPPGANDAIPGGSSWVNPTFGINEGEIMEVEPLIAVPNRSDFDYFIVETQDNQLDPTIYQDASSKNVHTSRKLIAKDRVVEGQSGVASVNDTLEFRYTVQLSKILFNGTPEFLTLLNSHLISQIEVGWETASFALAPGFSTDATYPLQVRKTGNKVEWRGVISIDDPGVVSGSVILSGFGSAIRPLIDKFHTVGINQAGDRHAALRFESGAGATVLIHHQNAASDLSIFFDGISYFV